MIGLSTQVPSLLPVTSDFIFKLIFGDQRNADVLTEFLKAVLDIPDSEYDRIAIVDPHVKKESLPQPVPIPLRQGLRGVYKFDRNKYPGAFKDAARR